MASPDNSMPEDSLTLSAITQAGRRRLAMPRICVSNYGDVMRMKEDLPASLPGLDSLRDFGGCYLVHGRYLLHAARVLGLSFASMVDVNVLPEFTVAADHLKLAQPGLRVESIQADFREPSLFQALEPTDAALLYEVLLHQENYLEVLRNVVTKTKKYICVAQPFLREELFLLPSAAVMLQFYDEVLKDLLRAGSFWPVEPRTLRFDPAFWMWGHTSSHLVDIMAGFGWDLSQGTVVDGVCGRWWEYSLMVFEPS